MSKLVLLAGFIGLAFFSSCNKSEVYPTSPLSDYNLQTPGKYIIYELDSLQFPNFGTEQATLMYYAKDLVDTSVVIDNLGRPAHPIFHFISMQSATGPWQQNNTFLNVPLGNTVEFIENNLRYIKLHEPIANGYTWKGNIYIDTYDQTTAIPDITDWDLTYLAGWDYTYQDVNQPLTLGSITLDSTITVTEQNESTGPITGNPEDQTSYSQISYGIEKYAKGIGLVYRNFLYHQYQPGPPPTYTGGYSIGYGITQTMLDHN